MKIPQTFRTRSRMMVAGLCGATVLTFSALDTTRVEAQQGPDASPSPSTELEADASASPEVSPSPDVSASPDVAKVDNQINLDNVSFQGEVVKEVGESAVIVRALDKELLLPLSLVTAGNSADNSNNSTDTSSDEGMNNDTAADDNGDDAAVTDDASPAASASPVVSASPTESAQAERTNYVEIGDNDLAAADLTQPQEGNEVSQGNDELANGNYTPIGEGQKTGQSSSQEMQSGDSVTVKLSGDAQIVALENGVLTVRSDNNVLQLPASVLGEEQTADVQLSREGGEKPMTLQQAIQNDEQLAFIDDLSSTMPKGAEVGVLVANQGDKVVLATPADGGSIQLVAIPQMFRAGQAVSLQQEGGEQVAMEPLQEQNTVVEHQQIELQGTLVSSNENAHILEHGEHRIVLPGDVKLSAEGSGTEKSDKGADGKEVTGDIKEGSQVTATLPAGEAEIVAVLDDLVVLDTGNGMAQLPMTMLEGASDSESLTKKGENLAQTELPTLESMKDQKQFQGMVVGREASLIVASLQGEQTQLLRVPAGEGQQNLKEGSIVEIDPGTQKVTSTEESTTGNETEAQPEVSPTP